MQKYAPPLTVAGVLVLVAALAFWPDGRARGGASVEPSEESEESGELDSNEGNGDQVELTMHIMSQCPYGAKVVQAITPVAEKLGNRFKLNLEYIGKNANGKLSSMHGESEVQGDKLQLCVHAQGNDAKWLSFMDCQNENWRNIPEGWETCAQQAEVDIEALKSCYEGERGTELLAASFERSVKAGARGSPSIFMGGERYNGGRSEQDFARSICPQYGSNQPSYCSDIPPPTSVPVTVLTDNRCTRDECNTDRQVEGLKARLPGAKITEIDFSSDQGREMFEKAQLKMLPALLVGQEIQREREAMKALRGLKRQGDMFVQTVGRFDPIKGEWLERPEVPIRFLVDSRCKTRECQAAGRFESFIKRQVPQAKISQIEYATAKGKALWRQLAATVGDEPIDSKRPPRPLGLPLALFGASIEQEAEAFSRLERRFKKVGAEYMFQLGPWDPTSEICDNELDDDGDGRIDCLDDQCSEQMVCRPEKRRELRAFVMSQCPYGVQVLNAMGEVLENFGNNPNKIGFRVEFVGQVGEDGELSTMHGQAELDENLREICAQRYYGKNYAFMDYILCRNKNIRSDEWEECVEAPLNAEVIRRCSEGAEGQKLLRESFELANSLGFTGSPSWLLNNRHTIRGRDPEAIKNEYCEKNALPECSNKLTSKAKKSAGSCG